MKVLRQYLRYISCGQPVCYALIQDGSTGAIVVNFFDILVVEKREKLASVARPVGKAWPSAGPPPDYNQRAPVEEVGIKIDLPQVYFQTPTNKREPKPQQNRSKEKRKGGEYFPTSFWLGPADRFLAVLCCLPWTLWK